MHKFTYVLHSRDQRSAIISVLRLGLYSLTYTGLPAQPWDKEKKIFSRVDQKANGLLDIIAGSSTEQLCSCCLDYKGINSSEIPSSLHYFQ